MARRISDGLLRRIRNEISIREVMENRLDIPCKWTEDVFRFLCPLCGDYHTATNPETNLGRCFRCQRNFNPIDITMVVEKCTFLEAVESLRQMIE